MSPALSAAMHGEQGWQIVYRADRPPVVRNILSYGVAIAAFSALWFVAINVSFEKYRGGIRSGPLVKPFDEAMRTGNWGADATWALLGMLVVGLPLLVALVSGSIAAAKWLAEKVRGPKLVRGRVARNVAGYVVRKETTPACITVGDVKFELPDERRKLVPVGCEALVEYGPLGHAALVVYVRQAPG